MYAYPHFEKMYAAEFPKFSFRKLCNLRLTLVHTIIIVRKKKNTFLSLVFEDNILAYTLK